jgi:glycosyltransferase involved in cell wall biosynthesis
MVEAYGVEPSRINVTRNGVDLRRFTPACEHPDGDLAGQSVVRGHGVTPGQYLCIVGRLEPRKNHANLVRAYLSLREPRPPLLIVGQRDFAYRGVFDLVKRHGLQQQVRFLEQIDDATLPALIRHCAAFVYPTWAEGFGMPVLEAMASGASVVTTDNTSLPEVAGDIALMCNPADVPSIAHAIQRALNEPHVAMRERQRRGIERARQFTWQRSAESLLQVYRRLLAKP